MLSHRPHTLGSFLATRPLPNVIDLRSGFYWKRGRVVESASLENWRLERVREFESHRFRQNFLSQVLR